MEGAVPAAEGAAVMAEGRKVGHVTYSDHGYSVGAVLASAHIEKGYAVEGVEVTAGGVKARVSRRAFIDPEGMRLRG